MTSKPSGDEGMTKKAIAPPAVITVDTTGKDAATPTKAYDSASQARTPKHANKGKDDDDSKDVTKYSDGSQHHQLRGPPQNHQRINSNQGWFPPNAPPPHQHYPGHGNFPPSQHFDNRMAPSQGAFQPRDRHSYPPHPAPPPAMQNSPGSGRYYYNNGPRGFGGGPAYGGHNDYPPVPQGHGYQHQRGYGPPAVYPPPPHQYSSASFDNTGMQGSSWGPPPSYSHGRPPPLPGSMLNQDPYNRGPPPIHHNPPGNNPNTFSRAVSNSFDRSTRSGDMKNAPGMEELAPMDHPQPLPHRDSGSLSEDASWGALKQVHSVDEEEMRKRLRKKKGAEAKKEVAVSQPESNSSSLTNSPTEGVAAKKQMETERSHSKRTSSLDSLSSVASVQEPMDVQKPLKQPNSPGAGSPASLDLMKCPSGSSGLLIPSHQRSLSQYSLSGLESDYNKRPHDGDEREDGETGNSSGGEESRKDSVEDPPQKKSRVDLHAKRNSPLTISCSPPTSPSNTKRHVKMHQPQATYPHSKQEASPGFYDKPPSSTYSMDSLPPPREQVPRPDSYPTLPPRPGSSASSTITPMNVEHVDMRQVPGVSQLPSWELHAQDSFGACSAGPGTALMGSFSFQQDYPMLSASASGDMHGHIHHQPPPQPHQLPPHNHMNHNQQLESRNQSFDGGHYHGGFGRTDSMMSYESRQAAAPFDNRQAYQGSFPPHAPSWGSAGSYQHGYTQHRTGYPPMMRNYSEDSGARASPPSGPVGMRMMPPNFPPPPEFRAPPSMVSKSVPQNTLMTSPYQPSPKVGPFGWTKDEDARLTEIMKKYKNPRDWEPIAKEHGRARSAKECHERWIRYLKPGVRKGQWTDHEDAIVMEAVSTSSEQPFTRWSDLAQRLPGRVGKQIRDRWVNHLNPAINHLPFSREDDLLLWEGHKKLGKRWVEISTKYFSNNRSENHIKNRWYSASFKKFITNQFGSEAYSGGKATKKESPNKKKASSPSPKRHSKDSDSQVQAV